MATNFLSLRSSAAASLTAVNLTGSAITTSTITVSTLNLQSTMVSLGQSTNQTYNNFSNGSYLTWTTAKSAMTSANKTVQSANGLYQMLVANATSGLFLSSDSGITWSTLSGGLPTLTGSAYWSDGAISANGQYITLSIYGGSLWMSADYGRTFALTNQPTPDIWLPLNGNTTDSMGLSVVTTPGTVPGYVTINYPGYTAQAVNLANTAGAAPTRYIQGTWAGATNFTVSFWFNAQTNSSGTIFSSSSGQTQIYLFGNYLYYATMINGSFANAAGTSYVISANTWYYVSATFLANGLCSLYVNNTLIGSATNTTALSAVSSYYLGCNSSISGAFNGYIDDLRITNSVSAYVPIPLLQPNIWMPFENSTADLGSNAITSTVTGSLSYVPGIVGLNAVNIANTPGGAATNFIQGNISASGVNVITVSAWFNAQSFPLTGASVIIGIGGISLGTYVAIYLSTTGSLVAYFLNSSTVSIIIGSVPSISLNTWYHVYLIFQQTGLCYAYLNGTLIGTPVAGSALFGSNLIYDYTLGRNVANNDVAFNGYVDDFRVYNAAIPYHTLFPQNYRSLALSGTGQYALAAAASGWVVGSSDSSRAWSKQAVTVGTQSDIIQPNLTGLGAASWQQNGVNWTATASSTYNGSTLAYVAFANNPAIAWAGAASAYGSSSPYAYTAGTYSTTILGNVGATSGDWLQLQSSVPVVLQSYTFASSGVNQMPKIYYIVGSMDGSTWYPLQYVTGVTNPLTTGNTTASSNLIMNYTGSQTVIGNTTGSYTTVSYTYTTQSYLYFRIVITNLWGYTNGNTNIGSWLVNFAKLSSAALSLNHTGQYQLVATGPAAGSVMPQQTGLAASTWSQGGVNWAASANVEYYPAYRAFNNLNASAADKWETIGAYTGGSFSYGGTATTSIQTIGSVGGDWLQIQSSVPLVLTSYSIGANDLIGRSPKTYYIVGSNDGSTWYPIQYCNFATIPFTTTFTTTSYITVNLSGTQSITAGQTVSATTITYTFTTNAYMYFRMVTTHLFSEILINIGEWNMNFRNSVSYSSNYGSTWLNTSSTVSNESVALSASGQYALSTNSVVPLARLTMDNTNVDAQGSLVPTTGAGTPGYSTSIVKVGTHSAQFANATVGGTPTVYLNYTLPAVLNKPSMLTMSFWMYPTGYAATSYVITLTNGTQLGPYFYFRSSVVGLTFNINGGANQYAEYAQAPPLNAWTHLAFTFTGSLLSFYMNGVLLGTMSSSGSLTLTNGGNITNLFVGTLVASSGAFAGNVDDVRIYTSALSAHEVAALYNNPALTQTIAVSNSYLPITSYTKPVLPGITANVVDTAVSQTGQYMVAVASSTTNNVYYSTDYGATFTALTVGSSAMVSCSISYDGSYLTVESATTVHTLNRNTRGFSVTVGNQAGLVNQAQNAIAIGNQAGKTNQSANSIVLNASGSALDAVAPGFYVAPIATAASSSAAPFNLLGYGTDNQIVQSSALTVLQNGNMGIGTANSTTPLTIYSSGFGTAYLSIYGPGTAGNTAGINLSPWGGTLRPGGTATTIWALDDGAFSAHLLFGTAALGAPGSSTVTERMRITSSGNVGIGTTAPQGALDVNGIIYVGTGANVGGQGMYINTGWVNPSNYNEFAPFQVAIRNTKVFVINTNGNVGIGITAPAQPLDVNGTIARNGLKLPRVDYGTLGPATSISIPILFSDTQYNMVEIRLRYEVSAVTDVNMSATSTAAAAMNLGEVGLTIVKYNSASAPSYYSNSGTTSFIFASTVEQVGTGGNLMFRIVRSVGSGSAGQRNHYSYDNVYCWSGVGTARGYGQGHIDNASVGGPALAYLNFSCVSGNINGNWSTTHYN